MSKNTAYLVGLLAAAAAGAAAGILLAPKKGSELRKDIQDKLDDVSEQLHHIARKTKHRANDRANEVYEHMDA